MLKSIGWEITREYPGAMLSLTGYAKNPLVSFLQETNMKTIL